MGRPNGKGETKHKIYLAVDYVPDHIFAVREDYCSPRDFYHFNAMKVKLSGSFADRIAYPGVFSALQEASRENGEDDPYLQVLFNKPLKSWQLNGPPDNGDNQNVCVRIELNSEALLRRLYQICGYNLVVNLWGYVHRRTYMRNQHFPLPSSSKVMSFQVDVNGRTNEKTEGTAPGLFGRHRLNGVFTVSIEWCGGYLKETNECYERMLKAVPTDTKIVLSDAEYSCHSFMLSGVSPVFSAMLQQDMLEGRTKKIIIDDVDDDTMHAFMDYVYFKNLQLANNSSNICFQLFCFAHKYDVKELESATRELLEGKPMEWMNIDIALELNSFATCLPDSETLTRKAQGALTKLPKLNSQTN